MKKKSVFAIAALISITPMAFAAQIDPLPFQGQHTTQAIAAVATSSYVGSLGIVKTAQISYPTVYVYPAYDEKWFSTVRACNTVGNLFAGSNMLPLRFDVFDGGGIIVRTLPNVPLIPNHCISYTSDVPGDPLFSGLTPGVYSVTATVIADNVDDLLLLLNEGGNLNGAVNSTARNFFKEQEQ